MNKKLPWVPLVAVLLVALAGAAAYYVWTTQRHEPPPAPPPVVQAAPPPTAPPPAPAIRYPVEPAAASAASLPPLPALDASDAAFGAALAQLFGRQGLPAVFYTDRMIRRIVATIDNLPRKDPAARMMPVKPVAGSFLVDRSAAGELTLAAANAARYALDLGLMQAIPVKGLVDVYIRFYPLFQQAYRELGYPQGYFNDRLIEALDDLLAAPDLKEPMALVQPKVLYEFGAADLERRSCGQKIMMRIGSDNAARAKAVVWAIRSELMNHTARVKPR